MAFNHFMHPRNIYRKKLDFEAMAQTYPEFAKYVNIDSKGKAFVDYENIDSLRMLTQTLFKKDFNLQVVIPEERLVPTIPMRLNYILWIEDLINHSDKLKNKPITAIDIGCGSCPVFPLLAISLNSDWNFVATDIDEVNLNYATLNIKQNNLTDKIKIYNNQNNETIFKTLIEENTDLHFNFLMTNPPFFDDNYNDSFENSVGNNYLTFHSKKINTASPLEAIYDGGEIAFIKKIIKESFEVKTMIDIYTVMIGKKKTFLELKQSFKDFLQSDQITSFNYTELCQGNTKRWAIAWTFNNHLNISDAPRIKCTKSKPLIHYLRPDMTACQYDMKCISDIIKRLLINDLKIETFSMIETKKKIEFDIKTNECNWKNQRKKRREQKRMEALENPEEISSDSYSNKRQLNGGVDNISIIQKKSKSSTDEPFKQYLTYLLHCGLIIKRCKQEIYIKMDTREMSLNKEMTHELFQYFKNKLI